MEEVNKKLPFGKNYLVDYILTDTKIDISKENHTKRRFLYIKGQTIVCCMIYMRKNF